VPIRPRTGSSSKRRRTCSLSSTDEPATALPEGYDTTENDPQPGLKDNPGKTGEIFSPDNNYVREAAPGAKQAVEKLMKREAEIGSNVPAGLNSQEQVAWIKNVHAVEEALNLEQGKPMTHAEANEHRANPNFTKGVRDAYSLNCQSCVVAYELRRRGYDVEARSRDAGGDTATRLAHNEALAWKTIDGESVTAKTVAGMQRSIDRRGNVHTSKRSTKDISKDVGELTKEVGRYSISWTWNEIDKATGKRVGHIVSAERFENGTIRLYDPQSGEFVSWNSVLEKFYFYGGMRVLRVDNLVPDENVIKNILLKK
jgi:hypothetical protein